MRISFFLFISSVPIACFVLRLWILFTNQFIFYCLQSRDHSKFILSFFFILFDINVFLCIVFYKFLFYAVHIQIQTSTSLAEFASFFFSFFLFCFSKYFQPANLLLAYYIDATHAKSFFFSRSSHTFALNWLNEIESSNEKTKQRRMEHENMKIKFILII